MATLGFPNPDPAIKLASRPSRTHALLTALIVTLLLGALAGCNLPVVDDALSGLPGFKSTIPSGLRVLSTPASATCGIQLDTAPMVFVFSASMETGPLTLPSPLDTLATQTWSSTNTDSDTLTLTPSTTWPDGPTPLSFTAFSHFGQQLLVYYTANTNSSLPATYYVSSSGSDVAAGTTPSTAFQTVPYAATQAVAPALVFVAKSNNAVAGTTNQDDSGNPYLGYDLGATPLALANQVSWCGGFTSSFTTRDPVANPTVLVNTAIAGGASVTSIVTTLSADNTVRSGSVLDGFTVVASGPGTIPGYPTTGIDYSAAIQSAGGLQVRNNLFVSGGSTASVTAYIHDSVSGSVNQTVMTGNRLESSSFVLPSAPILSVGLYVSAAAPVFDSGYIGNSSAGVQIQSTSTGDTATISNSDIDGGAQTFTTAGVWVEGGDAQILNNSEIHGGTSLGNAYGVFVSGAPSTVTISGNALIDGGTSPGSTYGIYFGGDVVTISNNTVISAGTGTSSAIGISILNGTSAQINNNGNISGGTGSTGTVGIQVNTSTVNITSNTEIHGGTASNNSSGIQISASPTVIISSNGLIDGGTGPNGSYGITTTGGIANVTIQNNTTIAGGNSSTVGSWGVNQSGGPFVIDSNTLISGGNSTSGDTRGVDVSAGSGGITNNVKIDGGIAGSSSVGLWIESGVSSASVLSNRFIYGGSAIASSIGVEDDTAGTTVNQNTINGGSGPNSTGINSFATSASLYNANTISGGSGGSQSLGINVTGSSTGVIIANNLISGCGKYGGATPFTCYGISVGGVSGVRIWNNTINGGSGSTASPHSSVGIFDGGTSTSMVNNIIFTSANGVIGTSGNTTCVDVTTATTPAFGYNDMFGCPDITYTGVYSTAINPTPGLDPAFASVGADPGQVDAADVDWHLTALTPAAITTGGDGPSGTCAIPLVGLPDRDGLTRGANPGMSMGAYRMLGDPGTGGC